MLLVGNHERSIERHVWTVWRGIVLQEVVTHEAITLQNIDKSQNLADLFTENSYTVAATANPMAALRT